jgi:agmatine/peptidylarginine deiminase
METPQLVLEGGSIDVDGAGNMLTTSRCLSAPTRNPDHDMAALGSRFRALLGVQRVLSLEHGHVAGDDTDGHVDMLARFCDTTTIAYTACEDPDDEHYLSLGWMKDELESFRTISDQPYTLIPLPLPRPVYDPEGQRLPASYSNFLIINDAVLVPTYDDPADEVALRRLQAAFSDREIVCVDCACLVQQYGSLHCMTMQLPAGVNFHRDPSDASRTSTTRKH